VKRVLAALPILVAALVLAGCGGEETTGLVGANTANGKDLFVKGSQGRPSCGSCHALADAGTVASVGPNLDQAFGYACKQGFSEDTIYDVVHDQIDLAAPPMPADLVTGQDADDVAAYVASVAGKDIPGCNPSGEGETAATTTTGG
jgi:mono/diheme cytochrome c family protein